MPSTQGIGKSLVAKNRTKLPNFRWIWSPPSSLAAGVRLPEFATSRLFFILCVFLSCSFVFAYENARFRRPGSLVLWIMIMIMIMIITYHRRMAPQLRYTFASLFSPSFLYSSIGAPVAKEVLSLSLHSVTDRMGRNTTTVTAFYAWPEYEKEALRLVDRCERLYQSFRHGRGDRLSNCMIE